MRPFVALMRRYVVDELSSAGSRVAFHITQHGLYAGGGDVFPE